jgi:radical SAM superfamily enzyme with C-terminal helix-hairpin-helix motif
MTWVVNKAGTNASPSSTDTPYSKVNRYLANLAAIVTATPQYPGECVVALDTFKTYQATDTTTGHFQELAVKQ